MMPFRARACVRRRELPYGAGMSATAKSRVVAIRLVLGGALATMALMTSKVALADEPVAPEIDMSPSKVPSPSTRPNLILVGAAVTAAWYGAAIGTSYIWPDSHSASSLRIPIAGPYMALAKTDGCNSREPSCTTLSVIVRTVFTSLSAIGQTGGVLAVLEGVFVPTAISESPKRASASSSASSLHVAVLPEPVGPTGVGLGLHGDF